MTDLDKLIAAVEAGRLPTFPETCRAVRGADGVDVDAAFGGSLDAAKRLHDALLPGWAWDVCDDGEADVWPYDDIIDDRVVGICRDNPARAWLLAILRAVTAGQHPA